MGRGLPTGKGRKASAAAPRFLPIPNWTGADLPVDLTSVDFFGYFSGHHHDQLVFVQRQGERHAWLYIGSAKGWEKVPHTWTQPKIFSEAEAAWGAGCLMASEHLRPGGD